MTFLEKELEDLLFEMLKDPMKLWQQRKFYALGELTWKRQVNLKNYGIADIVGLKVEVSEEHKKAKIQIHVIELKKDVINHATFGQACRYMTAIINEAIKKFGEDYEIKICSSISLVGTKIDQSEDFAWTSGAVDNLRLYKVSLNPYNGIMFHQLKNYRLENVETNCLQGIGPTEFLDIKIFYE